MSRQDSTKISDVKVMLKMGSDGAGITSIEKTGTVGLVDTYTITFDDGRKTTFDVTNGNGITSVEKTDTQGLVDTYTITFDDGTTETFTVTNGQDGGMSAKLLITSDAGSTVTVTTPSGIVISATQVSGSTTLWECNTSEFGVHTIDAILSGDDAQINVNVDTCKVYTIDDTHFHADITVTYPNGATCSCGKSGETPQYATTNPYTFTVHSAGTYIVTVTDGTNTKTEQVVITTSGQSESLNITLFETVPVTMYGAVGAIITWQNADGSNGSATMDGNGQKSTNVVIDPSGSSITFTDTTVAKNPNNLSQNYTKTVTVTNATTEIKVMPNDALYWWGYVNGLQEANTANGWTTGGYSNQVAPTWNTENIYLNTSSGLNACFVGTTNTSTKDKINCIINATGSGTYSGEYQITANKQFGSEQYIANTGGIKNLQYSGVSNNYFRIGTTSTSTPITVYAIYRS